MIEQFSQEDVSTVATKLLELGLHPSVVRRRLAERGLHWEYSWRTADGHAPQALRQRLRNLKHQRKGLCSECHANWYWLRGPVSVCAECLNKKWSGQAPEHFRAD